MKAAVLFTGGKDSYLALVLSKDKYEISLLVTFVPKNVSFKAHPIAIIKKQADSLSIPLLVLQIDEPYKEGYVNAIKKLKEQYGIEVLITGDIAQVEGNTNWIRECAKPVDIIVHTPLWSKDRETILNELLMLDTTIIFSLVKEPYFDATWVGKKITREVIAELKQKGIDMCGENGEFHTLVLDGRYFQYQVELGAFSHQKEENMHYLILPSTISATNSTNDS